MKFGFEMPEGVNRVEIPFEEYNNLVVIPVFINNLVKLKFIVDTGVDTPILTEETFARILGLHYNRAITISGPGIRDSIHAWVANGVRLALPGGIVGQNMNMLVLHEDYLKLSEKMGDEVYGIIGYDIFKQFVVEFDYDNKLLVLHRPDKFKPKKGYQTLHIDIVNTKPYLRSFIRQDTRADSIRLMIDTGASHALLLDMEQTSFSYPVKIIEARLGTGLGGEIPGYLGRLDFLSLKSLNFWDILISMPFQESYSLLIKRGSRNGTIGGEILSRVNPIFDYHNEVMYLRKGKRYESNFEYDMCGMTLVATGRLLDNLMVEYVRPESPAERAGIQIGDTIISVNGMNLKNSNLNSIYGLLRKKEKRKIAIKLTRNGHNMKKFLRLERAI
jgi:hypothetical protein